jgi:hypothetical protein
MTFIQATCQLKEVPSASGCNAAFTEPGAFVSHMALVHRRELGSISTRYADYSDRYRWVPWKPALPAKPWKAPRSKAPYEPKALDPGSQVCWRERVETGQTYTDEDFRDAGTGALYRGQTRAIWQTIERTGQVWSAGWAVKSVWVIPDLPFRNELAVLLQPDRHGDLRATSTYERVVTREKIPRDQLEAAS